MLKIGGALMLCMFLVCCSGTKPSTWGLKDGRLLPCPRSPNCVSTQDQSERHRIEPIRYTGTKEKAQQALFRVVGGMPGAVIVSQEGDYLHVEFTSRIFRFVDDVEFIFDDGNKLIHFRSASRLGHSDLGVNRNRMEEIRRQFGSD